MNFYKRHLGDIAKSCGDLSQGQMGAYDLLLDWHYANEKPLPLAADKLYRIGRAVTKDERKNVDSVISELFTRTADGYTHKRAAEEMEKASAQADTNRRIAEEREAKKRATKEARSVHEACNETPTNPTTNRQPSQTPDSRLQKEQKKKSKATVRQAALPDRFAEFWQAYPNHKAQPDAVKAWLQIAPVPVDEILARIPIQIAEDDYWRRGFVPMPATYLRQRRWEDDIAKPTINGANHAEPHRKLSPLERIRANAEAARGAG